MSSASASRLSVRWALLALALVAALALLGVASEVRFAGRRIGVSIEVAEQGGLVVLDSLPESPARRAGLRPGDRLLSLEGQPLHDTSDFVHVAERFRHGGGMRLEAAREGHAFETTLVPGMAVPWLDVVLGLLVVALYSALGLLAASRAAEDRRATLLALFSFAVAFELALPGHLTRDTLAALAVAVAFALVTGFQFGLELHLAASIPSPLPWLARHPASVRAPYLFGLTLGAFAALAAILDGIGIARAAPVRAFADSLLTTWMLPFWAVAVTALIGWRVARHPEPRGRYQAALVLLGLLPWFGVVMWETARKLGAPIAIVPELVWSLALLVYPVAIFAAIFLYQLFDLEWVVRKTFLYGALTSLLVLGFYTLVGAGGALFARQFDGGGASVWVVSTATLAMGLLFNPMRQRLEALIDRKMFPERKALRSRLVALAAELPVQGKLPRMGEHLTRELARVLGVGPVTLWIAAAPSGQLVELAASHRPTTDAERSALIAAEDPAIRRLLRDGRPSAAASLGDASPAMAERLAAAAAELAVPLVVQGRMIGLLLIGAKRDGSRFVAEELELLALLAHHVATVFENARLFDSATFEGLTGLFRRESILEILDREWNRAHRYDRPLAVAVADLDHFKSINDRHGHLNGDLVLQRVAAELTSLLRETDFVGRYGGEEFLIVLPETTLEGARSLAEKVRRRLEEVEIRLEGGAQARVTTSLGVASRSEVRADARSRGRALIAAADEALYAAKNAGRNRVEIAAAAR